MEGNEKEGKTKKRKKKEGTWKENKSDGNNKKERRKTKNTNTSQNVTRTKASLIHLLNVSTYICKLACGIIV